jgi:hypothetical protein
MTTTHETSMVVHAHECVIEGIMYRFGVRWAAAEELADPAFARVLLHVHVTAGDQSDSRPFTKLSVMAPLGQPAQIPRLLTDALRECLKTRRSAYDTHLATHRRGSV